MEKARTTKLSDRSTSGNEKSSTRGDLKSKRGNYGQLDKF